MHRIGLRESYYNNILISDVVIVREETEREKNSQVFCVRFEYLDRSKSDGSSGSLRSEALMVYLCGDQCWVTVLRGCSLRS